MSRSDLFVAYSDQIQLWPSAFPDTFCFHTDMARLEELRQNILRHAGNGSTSGAMVGLRLIRVEAPKPVSGKVIYKPMVCVIAQGTKTISCGDSRLQYGPSRYLLSAVDLPITGTIRNPTAGQPYLSLSLDIEREMLREVVATLPFVRKTASREKGLSVGALDDGLLDCFVRLTRLLDTPEYVSLIGPLVKREILTRLLLGEHGAILQQSADSGAEDGSVTQVIRWIRSHYTQPFSVAELASMAGMSQPSLHRHFRSITSMSPLQYQKQIRLQEARRLLVTEDRDAATVGFAVGYSSPSQFSREYHRAFGKPPRQDAALTTDQQAASVG